MYAESGGFGEGVDVAELLQEQEAEIQERLRSFEDLLLAILLWDEEELRSRAFTGRGRSLHGGPLESQPGCATCRLTPLGCAGPIEIGPDPGFKPHDQRPMEPGVASRRRSRLHSPDTEIFDRLARHCFHTGYAHQAHGFLQKISNGECQGWEECSLEGLRQIQSTFLVLNLRRTIETSCEIDALKDACASAFAYLIGISESHELELLKDEIHCPRERLGELALFTFRQLRAWTYDDLPEAFHAALSKQYLEALRESLRAFEDLVLAFFLIDDEGSFRRVLDARSRSPCGGPLLYPCVLKPIETGTVLMRLAEHCLRTGFAHMSEEIYRQHKRVELPYWNGLASWGLVQVLRTVRARAFLHDDEITDVCADALRRVISRSTSGDLNYIKECVIDLGPKACAEIAGYTHARCELMLPKNFAHLHRIGRVTLSQEMIDNHENITSFKDLVIALHCMDNENTWRRTV